MELKYSLCMAIRVAAEAAADREQGGMGQNELARRAKIDQGLMSRFIAGDAFLSGESLDRLARILQLRVITLSELERLRRAKRALKRSLEKR
jgi:transcriptional regulator with XRE-family HTH domain